MKKILLSTTLLAGFAASAAFADEGTGSGLDINIGGQLDFVFAYSDEDAAFQGADREYSFSNDTEIHFRATGVADNGLTYGAVIELEADVTSSEDSEGLNADKTYLFLESELGRVEMGSNTGAEGQLKVDAGTIARATGGIDGDYDNYITTTGVLGGTFINRPDLPSQLAEGASEDANKITYFTPRFSGFQAGVSYTVDTGSTGSVTGITSEMDAGNFENVFGLGLNYSGEFEGVGVQVSATGEFGTAETAGVDDLEAYALGTVLSYEGFSVAGSWGTFEEFGLPTGAASDDADFFTLGAAYETGPFGISITYLNSELGDNDLDNLVFGADYQLAPGLVPFVEVAVFDFDEAGTTVDNDEFLVLIGSSLTF